VGRILFLFFGLSLFYAVLLLGLWNEQVRYGNERSESISKQSIRRIRIPGARGKIFARGMEKLADVKMGRSLVLHLSEMRRPGKLKNTIEHIKSKIDQIAELTGREIKMDEKKIRYHIYYTPALPMTVIETLNPPELAKIAEIYPPIEGLEISVKPLRSYPHGDLCSHVIGYLGKEDPIMAQDKENYFYYVPDYTGRTGVEKLFDSRISVGGLELGRLNALPGASLVRVNTQGFVFETIETMASPEDGKSVVLTIDFKAQKTAGEMLAGLRGAFVLLDAGSGEVLAMHSSPGFDPGLFVPSIKSGDYSKLAGDAGRPFINRAISSAYMPGSVLKPLVALALMKSGIRPDEEVDCIGYSQFGRQKVRCWRTEGHGRLAMHDAIEQSCNCYFMEMSGRAGFDTMKAVFQDFGIGSKTGLELSENSGLCPSREYMKKVYGQKWNVFDTALLAIGQGIILVTPLQAAEYMALIANGGIAYRPHLLKAVYDSDGTLIIEIKGKEPRFSSDMDAACFNVVREGMFRVVHGERGTGKKADSEKITVYGKTGTAEFKSGEQKRKNTWMAGFAEKDGEKYSYALLVEDGISGGSTCAPLIKHFFNTWID
jgi:penicillin-binding protein 2